jgi:hypothetical protein
MLKYVDRIRQLSKLSNPDSVKLAYDLVLHLADSSFGDLDEVAGHGNRSSDEPADELLFVLANKRRKNGEEWDYKRTLEDLKWTRDAVTLYGIEPYFPTSIALFEGWSAETK